MWKWNLGFTVWQLGLLLVLGNGSAENAAAAMALSTIAMPIAGYLLGRLLHYRVRDWIGNMAGAVAPAALIGMALAWLGQVAGQDLPALLHMVVFGGLASLIYTAVIARLDPLIWSTIKARLARR